MINIVLYEPEIPQNTGNIMRTCDAMNLRLHLIEPLGFYLDEKHLRRAGLDYRKDTDYHVYPDWQTFCNMNEGEFYYVTRYGHRDPSSFTYPKDRDIYLVFGRESTGIPLEILRENRERCMRIPMVKEARSLNLSNCVAICAYTVCAQLGFPGLSSDEWIKGADWLERSESLK